MATAELREDSGPSTHLDNFEEATTNVSEFAQVVFNNIQECYTPATDLQCNYTLTPAIKPHSRDWIGVFKVGWTSTRQYRAFEWAVLPADWTDGQEWNEDLTFRAYYLPKDEDGEYYQMCYIDSAGKMRGASTPFQFLEQSADDFVQIIDDSMDILMIHNKSEYCVEELKRVEEEKNEIEEECNALREKVVAMETELKNAKEHVNKLSEDYEACLMSNQDLKEELKNVAGELAAAKEKLTDLSEEAGNYERSLQQTEGAFMEVVTRELALRNKLDELEKQHAHICADRDGFKDKVEVVQRNNAELCEEVDQLKELLSQSNETHQEVRENESRMKEEYERIQYELQQSSAHRDRYDLMETKCASVESSRAMMAKELDSLKMVQEKLSRDLVTAKTEKESLKVAMTRQTKSFNDERRKAQLLAHQNREKQGLLQEQINALKDGIQQLAQEKEMATKGTKGSQEAQQIATRDLKEKVRRANYQCREEVRRRSELQKKILSMESSFRDEKSDQMREAEDLKLRLSMAAEEYKKVYTESRQLQAKLDKRRSREGTSGSVTSSSSTMSYEANNLQASVTSTQTCELVRSSQGIQATTTQSSQSTQAQPTGSIQEKATQSGLPAVAVQQQQTEGALLRSPSRDDTFDLREMHQQMCELARELDERKKDVDKYRRLHQEEKEKASNREQVWQLKYQSLESKNRELQEKYNKMLNDYTNMKHSYESVKFDMDTQRKAQSKAPVGSPPRDQPMRFKNPYSNPESSPPAATVFGNPYEEGRAGAYPEGFMDVSVDSLNLDSIRYPPDTAVGDAMLTDASDSLPPVMLPEPLQPDVLPEGKIAAIRALASQVERGRDGEMVPQEHTDDEREDAQFVDAQEFPENNAAANRSPNVMVPPTSDTPPATPPATPTSPEPKKCPECVIEFPPSYPEEDFVKHVQRHFAKLCPVCQCLLPPNISQVDLQNHVEECLTKTSP